MSDLRDALRRAICPCPECQGHEAVLARVEVVAKRFGAKDDELPPVVTSIKHPTLSIDWESVDRDLEAPR